MSLTWQGIQLKFIVLVSVLVLAGGCTHHGHHGKQPRAKRVTSVENLVPIAPPKVKITKRNTRPNKSAVWVSGHWKWNGSRYLWLEGYWHKQPNGKIWIAGRWKQHKRGWIWMNGRWS